MFVINSFGQINLRPIYSASEPVAMDRSGWYGSSISYFYSIFEAGDIYIARLNSFTTPVAGNVIDKVKFRWLDSYYDNDNISQSADPDFKIIIYVGGNIDWISPVSLVADIDNAGRHTYDATAMGTVVREQNYTCYEGGWQEVTLTNPYTITGNEGEIWIGIECMGTTTVCIDVSANPGTDWGAGMLRSETATNEEVLSIPLHYTDNVYGYVIAEKYNILAHIDNGQADQPSSDWYALIYDPEDDATYPNVVQRIIFDEYYDSLYFYCAAFNMGPDSSYGDYFMSIYIDGETPLYIIDHQQIDFYTFGPGYGRRFGPISIMAIDELGEWGLSMGVPFNVCFNITYESAPDYHGIDPNLENNTYCVTYCSYHIHFTAQSEDENKGTVQIWGTPNIDNPYARIYATPNSCYRFDHWSDGSTDNPYYLAVTAGMTITAYFVEGDFDFYAQSEDESMGNVQVLTTPNCDEPTAVLYAVPNSGYHFDHWSTGSTNNPYTFTATNGMTVTAYFTEEEFHFTVQSEDESKGTVQILTAPTGYNTNAVLYAVPNSCYHFDHWSTGSTDNPYVLTVTSSMDIVAYFTEEDFVFSAISDDESTGAVQILTSPTCSNPHTVLYAVPSNGYHFDHWSTGSTDNPCVFAATNNMTVTAYFVEEDTPPSTNAPAIACVSVDQNNHNVVRWEPCDSIVPVRYNVYREGLGGYSIVGFVNFNGATEYCWVDDISNASTQTYSYKLSEVYADNSESDLSTAHTTMHLQINQGQGNTMNLTWTPYVGFNYDGYRIYHGTLPNNMSLLTTLASSNTTYSDINGSPTTLYLVEVVPSAKQGLIVTARSNITSVETPSSYTLTATSSDPTMGTVSGSGTYQPGEQAILEANPNNGYHFDHWSDGSTQASRIITVTGDATYIAHFASNQPEGITDTEEADIILYPNPTTGIVTARLSPETCTLTSEIRVFDVYGRMLNFVETFHETSLQTITIDLSQFATGIYLVKLVNNGTVVAVRKVVKQ